MASDSAAQDRIALAFQDLAECGATDRGLNRVLNIGNIDAPAGRGLAIDGEGEVGLADDAEESEIGNARESCSS
jgi:hypothetical protein